MADADPNSKNVRQRRIYVQMRMTELRQELEALKTEMSKLNSDLGTATKKK